MPGRGRNYTLRKIVIAVAVFLAVEVSALMVLLFVYKPEKEEVAEAAPTVSIEEETPKPPVIKTHTVVYAENVREVMQSVAELATYSYEYTGKAELVSVKQMDVTIPFTDEVIGQAELPGTRHTIKMTYSGSVKAGFDMQNVEIEVDEANLNIHVTLPEVKILSSGIDSNSIQVIEENALFNQITAEEMNQMRAEREAVELEKAIDNGIFDKALDNAKKVIRKVLSRFSDYEVVFDE